MDMLTDALGDLACVVTIDAQDARPLPGRIAVLSLSSRKRLLM